MHPEADCPTEVLPLVPDPPPRRRGREGWLIGGLVVAVIGVGAVVAVTRHRSSGEPVAGETPAVRTVSLERRDLSTTRKLDGSIGFGTPRTVSGHTDATVTWLPPVGATIKRGRQLFRADDQPVTLFYGGMPLYRAIAGRNLVGRDVRIVADNLRALGYEIGHQPSVGERVTRHVSPPPPAGGGTTRGETAAGATGDSSGDGASGDGASGNGTSGNATSGGGSSGNGASGGGASGGGSAGGGSTTVKVKEGEGVLTNRLIGAIKEWQEDAGLPTTGEIAVGDVEVLSGAVRVDSIAVQPGSPANTPLMSVTSTRKVITVSAELSEVASLERGDPVTVTLPDERVVKARILSVGRALTAPEGGVADGAPKLTVLVTVDDPKGIEKVDAADVTVNVTGKTAKGVLAAPIEALIALAEGGYAVQGPNGLVGVETGMFADGWVEITGNGLAEGMKVVVAS